MAWLSVIAGLVLALCRRLCSCILLAMLLVTSFAAGRDSTPQPSNIRLGADGSIRAWLLSGPFPNAPDGKGAPNGLWTDWLDGESKANPVEGTGVTHLREAGITDFWHPVLTASDSTYSLSDAFRSMTAGTAYFFTSILSPSDVEAKLELRIPEGGKLWVNGLVVWGGSELGPSPLPVTIRVKLQKGDNRLLVKTIHQSGPWSCAARFVDAKVYESLVVYETGTHAEPPGMRAIRAARGKKGALDLDAALGYDYWIRKATTWLGRFKDELPKAAGLQQIIVQSQRRVIAASDGDADQVSVALEHSRNVVADAYHLARADLIRLASNPPPLLKTNVAKEDFIRCTKQGRYFLHANGKVFIPIGLSETNTGPLLFPCDPDDDGYDPAATDAWLAKLAGAGLNLIRVAVKFPSEADGWSSEAPISPENLRLMDNIFLLAFKHGIKLVIRPNEGRPETPVATKGSNVAVSDAARRQTWLRIAHRDWKTLIDRWGNSGVVAAWELADDGQPKGGVPGTESQALSQELLTFIRTYELKRWGRNHAIVCRTRGSQTSDTPNHPNLAMADPDGVLVAFDGPSDYQSWLTEPGGDRFLTDPNVPSRWARGLVLKTRAWIERVHSQAPTLDLETLEGFQTSDDGAWENQLFERTAWSAIGAGLAGPGLEGPRRSLSPVDDRVISRLQRIQRLCAGVPWSSLMGRGTSVETGHLPANWIATGFVTQGGGLIYSGGPGDGDGVEVNANRKPLAGHFRAFDCDAGKWISKGTYQGALRIPPGCRSILFVLEK